MANQDLTVTLKVDRFAVAPGGAVKLTAIPSQSVYFEREGDAELYLTSLDN